METSNIIYYTQITVEKKNNANYEISSIDVDGNVESAIELNKLKDTLSSLNYTSEGEEISKLNNNLKEVNSTYLITSISLEEAYSDMIRAVYDVYITYTKV